MNWNTIFDGFWAFVNSPIGFTLAWMILIAFFFFLSSRFNPFQELWKRYEGSIITAIKLAEKQIPDDTHNAGLARLDRALQLVIQPYKDAHNGHVPSDRVIEQLKEGIQLKHHELDSHGELKKGSA